MRRIILGLPAIIFLTFFFTVTPAISGEMDQELIEVAGNGDVARLEDLLRKGADVNARDEDGQTPLIQASSEGREKL